MTSAAKESTSPPYVLAPGRVSPFPSEVELRLSTPDVQLVAGAVVTHRGHVLLIRRAMAAGSLLWTFPSGKVEAGEGPALAAVREAREEAGVDVEPLSLLGERIHPVTSRRIVYVACRLLSGQAHAASLREVSEVAWVGLEDLARLVPGGVFDPVQEYLEGRLHR